MGSGVVTRWLYAEWADPIRAPDKITQACTLYNPGVLPKTFKLTVQARDYLMAPLMPEQTETVTLARARRQPAPTRSNPA